MGHNIMRNTKVSLLVILVFILTVAGTVFVNAEDTVLKSGTCGDNLTWVLYDDLTLVISGTGEMYDWESGLQTPWSSGNANEKVRKVIVESGCTSIGNWAFSNTFVGEVQLANSIERIGKGAFSGKETLSKIILPSSCKTIEESAFMGCVNITSIVFPDSLEALGSCAFKNCKSIKEIIIKSKEFSVGNFAFDGLSGLNKVCFTGNEDEWNSLLKLSGFAYLDNYADEIVLNYDDTEFTVTYDANGGENLSETSATVVKNNKASLEVTATREGYEFLGWNTSKDASEALEELIVVDNATLYAVWKKIENVQKPVIKVSQVGDASSGGSFTINVSVSGNTGISGIMLDFGADKSVFFVECDDSDVVVSPGNLSPKSTVMGIETEAGWRIMWYNTSNVYSDAVLFSFKVNVSADAEPGTYPITVYCSPKGCVDENAKVVPVVTENLSVSVAEGKVISVIGDANGDNLFNNADLIYLARHLVGLDNLSDDEFLACDVNHDGLINNADLIFLSRVLVGLESFENIS